MIITTEFTTDRQMTREELGALLDSLYLQIEEPQKRNGNDADYKTSQIKVFLVEGEVN